MAVLQLYRMYLNHVHLTEHGLYWCAAKTRGHGDTRTWRKDHQLWCISPCLRVTPSPRHLPWLRQEVQLLEAATHNGFGVQTQPLLQQRGIGATEVVVVVQVAFEQLFRRQGWIFPVQPTLDRIADYKGDTTRAVVCPRAVVMHAPAKLREQKDHHVRAGVMLLQVLVECADGI